MSTVSLGTSIRKASGGVGAVIDGVDLTQPLSDGQMAELEQALLDHQVLVFPGQDALTPRQLADFGLRWGELHIHPAGGKHPDVDEVLVLDSTRGRVQPPFVQRGGWHSDVSWHATPPKISLLTAKLIPSVGGDTAFANQYLAYDFLPDGVKAKLEGATATHSADVFGRATAGIPDVSHPVVRTHPLTGRKALYVNPVFTKCIDGWDEEESKRMLHYLYDHATALEFSYRHTWTVGDLVMWDNRCLLHYAVRDYDEPRLMHRIAILGDEPR